jgi:dipeptidyl aminopeptidase/acylaminoacyl peptidase
VADLLTTRGASANVYTRVEESVWRVTSDGDASRIFTAPRGTVILAIDGSPSGEEVAVVLRSISGAGDDIEVAILDDDGARVATLDGFEPVPGTPVPGFVEEARAIDWSPQGDRLLLSFQGGTIIVLPVDDDGEPTVLDVEGGDGGVIAPTWSPTGQSIAFLSMADGGRRGLKVLDVDDGTVTEIVAPGEGRIVVEFAWMPDGVSLLFTEGGEPGSAITGIDLWRIGADGENRELVASAGTVAPVARIATIRPSPDGKTVAYAVLVPGSPGPRVDSVWVRDLASKLGFKIALPSVASVDDLWWTNKGLVFAVSTARTGTGRPPSQALLLADRAGSVRALWAAPLAQATPAGATPAATPGRR